MWIASIIISIIFCLTAWNLSVNKSKKTYLASFGSMSFAIITLFMEYRMVLNWVNKEDWSALLDVMPSMFKVLGVYVIVIMAANIIPIAIMRKE